MEKDSIREKYFDYIWMALWPLRLYLKSFPIHRGKGIILKLFIIPFLPPSEKKYSLSLPGGGAISVGYRETIGLSSLLYGVFEEGELEFVSRFVRQGEICFDIGANIGVFSVVMGRSVGSKGQVIAIDPIPDNIVRLRDNASRNSLDEIIGVFECAVGNEPGELVMRVPDDTVYASSCDSEYLRGRKCSDIRVPLRTLDDIWRECGSPKVSFLKLDVEGGERKVLEGAKQMIMSSYPTILSEANTKDDLGDLEDFLCPLGYRWIRPEGFSLHNYVFFRPVHDSIDI